MKRRAGGRGEDGEEGEERGRKGSSHQERIEFEGLVEVKTRVDLMWSRDGGGDCMESEWSNCDGLRSNSIERE